MVNNRFRKGLVSAITAVTLATSGAPALAENADNIGNNRKCDYTPMGIPTSMAHSFAASDLTDMLSVKVADGGVVKYSPSAGICEYKGSPYGSPVGLVGIVTENGVPVPQYTSKGLQAVDANMTTAYVVTGLIVLGTIAAYASVAKGSAATVAPGGGGGFGGGGGL